jgi:hypothetical protein
LLINKLSTAWTPVGVVTYLNLEKLPLLRRGPGGLFFLLLLESFDGLP